MLRQPCLLTAETNDFEELARAYRDIAPWALLVPVTLTYWAVAALTQQALGSVPQGWQHAGYVMQAPLLMCWGRWLHQRHFASKLRMSAFNALLACALGPLAGLSGSWFLQALR